VAIIMIPVAILVPLLLVVVPPGPNAVVAPFALSPQLGTPGASFCAIFPVLANGSIKFRFRLPDPVFGRQLLA